MSDNPGFRIRPITEFEGMLYRVGPACWFEIVGGHEFKHVHYPSGVHHCEVDGRAVCWTAYKLALRAARQAMRKSRLPMLGPVF